MSRGAARTCRSCGTLNKPKWEFCARCGEPLDAAAVSQAEAAPPPDEPEYDSDVSFPWRPLLSLSLVAAVIAAAVAIRRAGPATSDVAIVMPTVAVEPPPAGASNVPSD